MKAAVISDIHGNYIALEEVLKELKKQKIKKIICLGDYLTDSPFPEKVLEVLSEMRIKFDCIMLKGNREEYLIDNRKQDQKWGPSSQTGLLHYTDLHVTGDELSFFEDLESEKVISYPFQEPITICHGLPGQIRGNKELEREKFINAMKELSTNWLIGGHTHRQIVEEYKGKHYLNPGSVGLAIDGMGGRAEFAILEWKEDRYIPFLYSIPYNVDEMMTEFHKSDITEYGKVLSLAIQKTMKTGKNYFFETILEVESKLQHMNSNACSDEKKEELFQEVWDKISKEGLL